MRVLYFILFTFTSIVPSSALELPKLKWNNPLSQCAGTCSLGVFHGTYVHTGMNTIVRDKIPPWDWDYREDYIFGVTASRRIFSIADILHFEPEIGFGQRYGKQHESEIWAALFVRFDGFPWNSYLHTSIAISTGLNYATDISEIEEKRGGAYGGSQLIHYLAPEITFALPNHLDKQLFFRGHHRSGGYGLVSETRGGAQYGTMGIRFLF